MQRERLEGATPRLDDDDVYDDEGSKPKEENSTPAARRQGWVPSIRSAMNSIFTRDPARASCVVIQPRPVPQETRGRPNSFDASANHAPPYSPVHQSYPMGSVPQPTLNNAPPCSPVYQSYPMGFARHQTQSPYSQGHQTGNQHQRSMVQSSWPIQVGPRHGSTTMSPANFTSFPGSSSRDPHSGNSGHLTAAPTAPGYHHHSAATLSETPSRATTSPDAAPRASAKPYRATTCSICQEIVKSRDACSRMECSHVMHKLCAERYLQEGDSRCPICRQGCGELQHFSYRLTTKASTPRGQQEQNSSARGSAQKRDREAENAAESGSSETGKRSRKYSSYLAETSPSEEGVAT